MRRVLALFVLLFSSASLASGGGGGGGFVNGAHNYYPLDPPFVVNLRDGDRLRFMQAAIQVMTYDTAVIAALEKHKAPVRNALLLLLSDQTVSGMQDPRHRARVQQEALEAVQHALEKYAGISNAGRVEDAEGKSHPSGVQELYFTDLVVQ